MNSDFLNLENLVRKNNVHLPMTTSRPPLLDAGNYSNLAPLKQDTVSFKGTVQKVKKTDFTGVDFAVVEKFKAPIEKFKTTEDLQNWATEKIKKDIVEKNFRGRQEESRTQRKFMIKEWVDYVTKENDAYTPATQLLILTAITKELKPNNDKIPPVLNKGVLADTVSDISKRLKENPKENFDLLKIYQTKLNSIYLEETQSGEKGKKWIIIPSKLHDPENFESNVEKLKALSHKNWCTKSFNAEPYLSEGDFHIYMEDGKPKLGIRFIGESIDEIEGEKNDGKIPPLYFDIAEKHVKGNKYHFTFMGEDEFLTSKAVTNALNVLRSKIGEEAIKTNDPEKILPRFGISVKKDTDGLCILSQYNVPDNGFDLSEIGVNENEMFKKIKRIENDAIFRDTTVTDLGNLESIGGDADFQYSKIENLGKLKRIEGTANFGNCGIKDLGELEHIGHHAVFWDNYNIQSLGNLEYIGGDLLAEKRITDLGKLQKVAGAVCLDSSPLTANDFEIVDVEGGLDLKIFR